MQSYTEKESVKATQPEPTIIKTHPPEQIKSSLTDKYTDIMSHFHLSSTDLVHLTSQLSTLENIKYDPDLFYDQLTATIDEYMPNYQIVILALAYGHFRMSVRVYCQEEESMSHHLPNKDNRQESTIFFTGNQSEDMVVKCYPFEPHQQISDVFGVALKEYCLMKIASGLGVGPRAIQHGGFDLILTKKCVQFGMEKCIELSEIISRTQLKIEEVMINKLNILHAFQIVHMDIKQANIMYSQLTEELVFIDFGFSRLIQEKIGFKTKCSFAGSFSYCGPEMLSVFKNNLTTQIDLYYNDAHALRVTMNQLIRHQQKIEWNRSTIQDDELNTDTNMYFPQNIDKLKAFHDQQTILKIKKCLYFRESIILENQCYKRHLLQEKQIFIIFILQFPFYEYFNEVYNYILKNTKFKQFAQEYSKRMEYKKEKLFAGLLKQGAKGEGQRVNLFIEMLELNVHSEQVLLKVGDSRILLVVRQNLKAKLMEIASIKKMGKLQYFSMVAKVANLVSSLSNLSQKKQICNLFKQQTMPIDPTIKLESNHPEIEYCFKYLLSYFISTESKYYDRVIPLALINLVILEAVSTEEIKEIIIKGRNIKGKPESVALLLFRIREIFEWLREKIDSRYDQKNYYELLLSLENAIIDLNKASSSSFVNMIEKLFLVTVQKNRITNNCMIYIKKQLTKYAEKDKEMIREVMMVAIYQHCLRKGGNHQQKHLKMIVAFHQECDFDFDKADKLEAIHLKINQKLPQNVNPNNHQGNYMRIFECLKQAGLARQFSFYYFQMLNYKHGQLESKIKSEQFVEDISYLSNIIEKTRCKEGLRSIMKWIYVMNQRVIGLKSSSVIYRTQCLFRKLVNSQTLDLAQNNFDSKHFITFFDVFYYLLEMCYTLYPRKYHQTFNLRGLYENIKQLHQSSICEHCNVIYQHTIHKVKLTLYLYEEKFEEGVKLCKNQIKYILTLRNSWIFSYCRLDEYLGKMVVLIDLIEEEKIKSKYAFEVFSLIKEHNLYEFSFAEELGKQIYNFISKYTMTVISSVPDYIRFQKQLLRLIFEYPFSMHVTIYCHGLEQFANSQLQSFRDKGYQIVELELENIRKEQKGNPYGCLFLGFFLRLPLKEQLYHRLVVRVCEYVDLVSLKVRVIVMEYILQFLYNTNFISISRSNRRKLMLYSNYICSEDSFKIFSQKLRWPYDRRSENIHEKKLAECKKKFYRCLMR